MLKIVEKRRQVRENMKLPWIIKYFLLIIFRRCNEEEDIYQLRIDRINAEAAAPCEVALAITKIAIEGPIILKGFSAYICGSDDNLTQLELKNPATSALQTARILFSLFQPNIASDTFVQIILILRKKSASKHTICTKPLQCNGEYSNPHRDTTQLCMEDIAYRRLATMAEYETISPRERLEAEKAGCEVAVAIVKLQFEGPIILKDVCA